MEITTEKDKERQTYPDKHNYRHTHKDKQWHRTTPRQTHRQTDARQKEKHTCVSLKSRSRMWWGRRFLSRLTCSSASFTDGKTPAAFSLPLGEVSGNSPAMYIRSTSTSGWNDTATWELCERTRRTRTRRRCESDPLTPSLGGMWYGQVAEGHIDV